MSGRKTMAVTAGFVVSVSLIAAAVSVLLVSYHYSRRQFDLLNGVCGELTAQDPEIGKTIAAVLKEYTHGSPDGIPRTDVLGTLGYRVSDFSGLAYGRIMLYTAAGFVTGVLLFLVTFLYRNHHENLRIRALASYLEQVNAGRAAVLSVSGEDDFSKLEDEIYKTVTYLGRTKEEAVRARQEFADNLSNIAHQIKTPITAISLSLQMMRQERADAACVSCRLRPAHCMESACDAGHLEQAEKQLLRLTRLEEALLLLSRIDAGTLSLQKKETDVFTLLVLAADTLQELFDSTGTAVEIPELGEKRIVVDPDWTMEAVMNLMKNCMEHGRGGRIHCSYAQNPLYTEILLWDEGQGFAREDLPRLFERFYRGKDAGEGGIGIGLALAREIIERQNGTIRAQNRAGGGALFEIRFYVVTER